MAAPHSDNLWANPETWVAVAFVIFMGIFVRYALAPITRALDTRGTRIADELATAHKLREEAEALLRSYKQQEAAALAEAEAVLKHAREEAEIMKAQAAADMKAAIDRRIAQASEKIARAESEAVESIRAQIIELAMNATREAIAEKLAEGEDPAIAEAIRQAGRIVH